MICVLFYEKSDEYIDFLIWGSKNSWVISFVGGFWYTN